MKVLLRTLDGGSPLPRYRAFEALLKCCLRTLEHEVIELELDGSFPPDPPEAELKVYAHKSRREVPNADLFYKEMYVRGLFTIDSLGWGGEHSGLREPPDVSNQDPGPARHFCEGLRQSFLKSGRSKHRQPRLRRIPENVRPYLLAPLQVPDDDAVKYQSPYSVLKYVETLVAWAEESRHNIVFKPHPGAALPDIGAILRARGLSGQYVFVLNENIHALIAASAGVVVLTSGVGFESLIHGKPVVTLGNPDYRWATCHVGVGDGKRALDYIRAYSAIQQQAAYNFVALYYQEHAYDIASSRIKPVIARLLGYLSHVIQNASGGLELQKIA